MSDARIFRADSSHLEDVARLFDGYRVFYRQPSDLDAATAFMKDRLEKGDAVVLCAELDGAVVGFTQLYPSFTSVGMAAIWVLNDLYVASGARRRGVARALLDAAADHARSTGAVRLTLETEESNVQAQALYEDMGWVKETGVFHYSFGV